MIEPTSFIAGAAAIAGAIYIAAGWETARALIGKPTDLGDVAAFAMTILIWPIVRT